MTEEIYKIITHYNCELLGPISGISHTEIRRVYRLPSGKFTTIKPRENKAKKVK